MFNKIILIGRLGQNAEAKTSQNNREFVVLHIATQESWKNEKGDTKPGPNGIASSPGAISPNSPKPCKRASLSLSKARWPHLERPTDPRDPQYVIELVRARYAGFGPKLAAEVLLAKDGVKASRETLRKWMIEEGLWLSRKQRRSHFIRNIMH